MTDIETEPKKVSRLIVKMDPGICRVSSCVEFGAHTHEKCPDCFVVDNYRRSCVTCVGVFTARLKEMEQAAIEAEKQEESCAVGAGLGVADARVEAERSDSSR
jgi:hypothetical protein